MTLSTINVGVGLKVRLGIRLAVGVVEGGADVIVFVDEDRITGAASVLLAAKTIPEISRMVAAVPMTNPRPKYLISVNIGMLWRVRRLSG